MPKFQSTNLQHNLQIADKLIDLSKIKKCTPTQLALAWLLAQSEHIVPIPGTRSITRLEENIGALNARLSESDLNNIRTFINTHPSIGEQYPAQFNFEV